MSLVLVFFKLFVLVLFVPILFALLILAFFDFGTSISRQGVSVSVRARDLEGLRILADDIEAIGKVELNSW